MFLDAAKVANQTENDEAGEESIEYVDGED